MLPEPAINPEALDRVNSLSEQLEELLSIGAPTYAVRTFRQELHHAEQRQMAMDALVQVACEMSRVAGKFDLDKLMSFVLDQALKLVGAERGLLVMQPVGEKTFKVVASKHLDDLDASDIDFSKSLLSQVIESREPVVTTNAQNDPRFSAKQSILTLAIRSVLAVPLITPTGVIGALYLDTQISTRVFNTSDLPIVSAFAGITASAVELARVLEVRQALYLESVKALVSAVEAKDAYTAGHSSRVGLYAQGIMRAIGKPEAEAEQALIAGYLHDVGKIGISDAYVSKPGPLSSDEWTDFKKHTVIGERILAHSSALKAILPAVRWHHEKLDGSGYPDGLTANEIPLLARVVCVADSFDAMTSDRPYRQSPGRAYALAELKKYAGKHYDPALVKALELAFEKKLIPYLGKG